MANEIQALREKYIRVLDGASNATERATQLADDLFSLDLTVYSSDFTFKSTLYNALSMSIVDPKVSLHPDQLEIIDCIESNAAVVVSAPTSFGKTFCIFEYIARHQPSTVVLVVPTLALVDEYMKKIIKRYADAFESYRVHTSFDPDAEYDFAAKNIFILTHDRIVQPEVVPRLTAIDFLVIDEVYKLETDKSDDRVLVLNMAYHYLSRIAKKYILLAPFLGGIKDIEALEKRPIFFRSDYSPVVNEVRVQNVMSEDERFYECDRLVRSLPDGEKTLIYFPTVSKMNKYIANVIACLPDSNNINTSVREFIDWAKDEIHEEWSLVRAMEKGYLVHNGQIPRGVRRFQLDQYENGSCFNRLLCTSTLLEGVNTVARSIVITKPARGSRNNSSGVFTAFDFFNLVGRTGRLNQHLIGTAYYIKGPDDPVYLIDDAVREIRFELTDDSVDVDMQLESLENRPEVIAFLEHLGITIEAYIENIGPRFRFETVRGLYDAYVGRRDALLGILEKYLENERKGRYDLVRILLKIIDSSLTEYHASIVNELLKGGPSKLRTRIDNVASFYSGISLDLIISTMIRYKYGFVEHEFYGKTKIVAFFLSLDGVDSAAIGVLTEKIINAVDARYFASSPVKRAMFELGIYERDIERIAKIVGEDLPDTRSLVTAIKNNRSKMKSISYMSKYVIDNLVS